MIIRVLVAQVAIEKQVAAKLGGVVDEDDRCWDGWLDEVLNLGRVRRWD